MEKQAEALTQALAYHRAGDFDRAESLFRRLLEADPAQAEAWCYLGDICLRRGRLAEAVSNYRRAVELRPDYAAAHHDLGVALANEGQSDQAAASFRRALACRPDYAEAHSNLGGVLTRQGKLMEAVRCFQEALRIRPDYVEAHNNLGLVRAYLGQLPQALASHQRAVEINPDSPASQQYVREAQAAQQRLDQELTFFCMTHGDIKDEPAAYQELGLALQAGGRWLEALACFQEVVCQRPDFAEAYLHLGDTFKERGHLNEAILCFRQALTLKPDYLVALRYLGLALDSAGKVEEAVTCFQKALESDPADVEAYNSLGCALRELGRQDEAVECFQKALRLEPESAPAQNNWGALLDRQGKFDEALTHYEEALRRNPHNADIHLNRAVLWLLRGDLRRGWEELEWRWRLKGLSERTFAQPRWDGTDLKERVILLHAEFGLGDTLQFIRYAPLVKKRGGTVLVRAQASVLPVLAGCPGIDQLLAQDAPLPSFDVHAPLLSLPNIIGIDLSSIPADIPYLVAEQERVERWRRELAGFGSGFRIGLVWQGNPDHRYDRRRSVPLEQFAPLARKERVRLFSLQVGHGTEQLADAGRRLGVIDLGSRFDRSSLADVAAVLKGLDLLVTIDSALGHLAGGLGVPTWLALPFVPEWRWLLEREDSPWYPRHRLFRQTELEKWEPVFERMAGALDQHLV